MRDYLWASPVGRIRIIEKGLLTKGDLRKVLDTDSLEGALAALRDSFYGPYVSKLENSALFESALQKAAKDAGDSVMQLAPEPMVIAAYRARNDFHNLKVFLKSEVLGVLGEEEAFTHLGNLPPDSLKKMLEGAVEEESPLEPPEFEADSIEESAWKVALKLVDLYSQVLQATEVEELCSFEVDSWIDKEYYAWAAVVYRKHGYDQLFDFIKAEIDIVNLKMAIRARLLEISDDNFDKIALLGGNLKVVELAQAYSQGLDSIASLYEKTMLGDLAKRGVSLAQRSEPLTAWERECDNVMIEIIRKAAKICLGPEPVFGYMFGREIEVKNLRIILSGKQALIPEHEISGRLRESYA